MVNNVANFDLSQYQTVDERIALFWSQYPNGRILTELTHLHQNEAGQLVQVIVRASVWRDINDEFPAAVDYAEETLGSNPVNRTSFIENAVTSGIGRGLATLGLSPKKPTGEAANLRPTREEMTKSERVTGKATSKLPNLTEVVNDALIAAGEPPIAKEKAPNYSSPHPNPTEAQRATLEKRASELKIPPARLEDYLNMILGRDFGTRISKRDASELIGMDRETWADIAKVMGF